MMDMMVNLFKKTYSTQVKGLRRSDSLTSFFRFKNFSYVRPLSTITKGFEYIRLSGTLFGTDFIPYFKRRGKFEYQIVTVYELSYFAKLPLKSI